MSVHGRTEWTLSCKKCMYVYKNSDVGKVNERAEEHLEKNQDHEMELVESTIYFWEW